MLSSLSSPIGLLRRDASKEKGPSSMGFSVNTRRAIRDFQRRSGLSYMQVRQLVLDGVDLSAYPVPLSAEAGLSPAASEPGDASLFQGFALGSGSQLTTDDGAISVFGGTGSGHTNVTRLLVNEALDMGAKVLCFDFKGGAFETVPDDLGAGRFELFTPSSVRDRWAETLERLKPVVAEVSERVARSGEGMAPEPMLVVFSHLQMLCPGNGVSVFYQELYQAVLGSIMRLLEAPEEANVRVVLNTQGPVSAYMDLKVLEGFIGSSLMCSRSVDGFFVQPLHVVGASAVPIERAGGFAA